MTFDLRCLSGTAEPGASAARSRPARKVSGPGTVGRQSGVLSSASAATNRAFQMVDRSKDFDFHKLQILYKQDDL